MAAAGAPPLPRSPRCRRRVADDERRGTDVVERAAYGRRVVGQTRRTVVAREFERCGRRRLRRRSRVARASYARAHARSRGQQRTDGHVMIAFGGRSCGKSARTDVPCPGALATWRRPPSGLDAVLRGRGGRTRRRGSRAADPVVGDRDERGGRRARAPRRARRWRCVLGVVDQRLGDEVVRGTSTGCAGARRRSKVTSTGMRRPLREGEDGGLQAAVGQHGGVQSARQLAQLGERLR